MKKVLFGLVIIISILLTGISSYSILNDKEHIDFKLNGKKYVKINIGESYNEDGFDIKKCIGSNCEDLKDLVSIEGNIDSSKVGDYELVYKYNNEDKEYKLKRIITVVDNVNPIISLNGGSNVTICPNQTYQDEGFQAIDNYDGDITNYVTTIANKSKIKYIARDSSNNATEVTRKIYYGDGDKPTIILTGGNVVLYVGNNYQERGYQAFDNCDGNITSNVIVSNNVDTSKAGTYFVSYSVSDSSGNYVSVSRKVTVKEGSVNGPLDDYLYNLGNNVSVLYYDIDSGYQYTYNPNKVYYGASLIKTLDALYIYNNTDVSDTDSALVAKAISVSDNPSHQSLVNKIGRDNLKAYGQSLGASYVLSSGDNYGNTVVYDQLVYMKELYKFITTNEKGKELKSYFVNTFCNSLIFDGLPTTLHKYGYYSTYYHDVGIVLDNHPYIIVVLSNKGYFNNKTVIQNISKNIYNYHKARYS